MKQIDITLKQDTRTSAGPATESFALAIVIPRFIKINLHKLSVQTRRVPSAKISLRVKSKPLFSHLA